MEKRDDLSATNGFQQRNYSRCTVETSVKPDPDSSREMKEPLTVDLSELVSCSNDDEMKPLSPQAPRPPPPSFELEAWEAFLNNAFLIVRLAVKLYSYLFLGLRWWFKLVRLVLFALVLMPGFSQVGEGSSNSTETRTCFACLPLQCAAPLFVPFCPSCPLSKFPLSHCDTMHSLQMVAFYFFSPRLLRGVPYRSLPRNTLDVYLPRKRWRKKECPCTALRGPVQSSPAPGAPVVIYVTGGAWTIGHKAWGALFGRRLSQRGLLVMCLDYRNFPQASAIDMLEDVNAGIAWCLDNAHLYGGDGDRVLLVGQSAGGHLTSLALLAQAEAGVAGSGRQKKVGEEEEEDGLVEAATPLPFYGCAPRWDLGRIKGYVGVSGAYDLVTLADHLHRRGLYKRLFEGIMSVDGVPSLAELSPTHAAARLCADAVKALPPIVLMHGSADNSVPFTNAQRYASALARAGAKVGLRAFPGKTHTQPIIEDPMRGGRDELMDAVLELATGGAGVNHQFPMCPAVLLNLASAVCPF
jgi:prenylcysteine alpha-carboxyl methylesterase